VVDFAKKNELVVIQDAAYAALTYDSPPYSFLSVPGARDVGVEVHSLSKAFNMTGWRLAFVAGNELIVKAFASVKDNYDSGQFKAIQWAGIKALENPSITVATREKYQRRLSRLVDILKKCGFHATMPGGTFDLYVAIPKSANGTEFSNAEEFSQFLIREKLISTVPWDDVGHYVRFSATFETGADGEEAVLSEIESRLSGIDFTF
jgi:LL-diaminopimelate aminotransferase